MNPVRAIQAAKEVYLGADPALVLQRPPEQLILPAPVDFQDRQRARAVRRQEIDEAGVPGPEVRVEGEQPLLDNSRVRQDPLPDGLEVVRRFSDGVDGQPLPAQPTVRNLQLENPTRAIGSRRARNADGMMRRRAGRAGMKDRMRRGGAWIGGPDSPVSCLSNSAPVPGPKTAANRRVTSQSRCSQTKCQGSVTSESTMVHLSGVPNSGKAFQGTDSIPVTTGKRFRSGGNTPIP